ncbi:potassium channel subfamily K member 6 [Ambystoma mexicanum]|uniref:potassium channel subfamily K member 6 n=1 Tax=Ambystoma mexicanum TaxID=8296 RepID=UPI0037E84A68
MKSWVVLTILIVVYVAYLLLGALVVSRIEGPYEAQKRQELREYKAAFLRDSHFCVNESDLEAFLEKVLSANKYGVSVLRNASTDSNWDFASALFFASTLVTTVGYGYTTPLSDSGKGFCIFFALIGVPFTMLVLTASVQRLMSIFTYAPINFFQLHRGYSRHTVTKVHFVVLLLLMLVFFFLVPSAIFSTIEASWTYLDAFYFCFISLCTIGLGDYVPGEQYDQKLRPLYKVCVTCYLLIGLMAMLLILQTFHKAADLHGLTDLVLLPSEQELEADDQERILNPSHSPQTSEPRETETSKQQLQPTTHTSYSSINR